MKKFAVVLTLFCLLLSAGAAEVAEVNWADVEPGVAALGLEGEFVSFDEVALKIWIPSSMEEVELTEEEEAQGFIACFMDDDETAQISVVYVDMDGMELDEYAQKLPEVGAENVVMERINGLDAVEYKLPENDSLTVAFATQAGYILEVTMAPASAENADIAWGIVGSSIQPE